IGDVPLTVPAVTFGETVKVFKEVSGLPLQAITVYTISVVPAATAVTSPVVAFTVATEVLVLLHAPPPSPLLEYVDAAPIQSGVAPLMVPVAGSKLTVSVLNELTGLLHPVLTVYVIFVVPAATAVTSPVPAFTVATEVLVLVHEPPPSPLLVYAAVAAMQSGEVPLTVPAFAF